MNNNIIVSLIRSCSDFKFYREILPQSLGKTLRYLLVLMLLVAVVLGVRFGFFINTMSNKGLSWLEENIPYIEIVDGEVMVDADQPFIIEEKDFIGIIDTTGKTAEVPDDFPSGILLTKDKLFIKRDSLRTEEINLAKVQSFQLDDETLKKWRLIIVSAIIPLMLIFMYLYMLFTKFIQALIAGLIITLFKPQLKLNNTLNICVYALTPVTILSALIFLVTLKPLPFFFVVYLGMYVAFIWGGLRACRPEQEQGQDQSLPQ